MKKRLILFALAIAALVFPLFACGNNASSNTGTAASTTTSASGTTPTTAPAQHFKVGQVVKVGDTWQVTVNSAKTSKGGEFDSLKSGDIYLEISVSLKNLSSQEQTASSALFWTLQDSSGQKYDLTFASDSPSTPDGKVEANGGLLKGTLTYEVPQATTAFTLAFAPDLLASGQTIWDITIK